MVFKIFLKILTSVLNMMPSVINQLFLSKFLFVRKNNFRLACYEFVNVQLVEALLNLNYLLENLA